MKTEQQTETPKLGTLISNAASLRQLADDYEAGLVPGFVVAAYRPGDVPDVQTIFSFERGRSLADECAIANFCYYELGQYLKALKTFLAPNL